MAGLLLLLPAAVRAEVASLGLAGAYALRASGVDAAAWNPATLAWSPGLDCRVLSLGASLQNSAFSVDEYNRWNGSAWDDDDKEAILARIDDSFEGAFRLAVEGPGVAWRRWSLTTGARAAGFASLPREYARLVLYGNDPAESYDLGGSDGEGLAWSELRLTHARPLGVLRARGVPLSVVAGANVKYLFGWGYGEVTRAEGSLETTDEGIFGHQLVVTRTSEGGSGLGCDLGVAARAPNGWSFGLNIENAVSTLRWSRAPRRQTSTIHADSLTVSGTEEGEDAVETDSVEETIPAFRASPPATLTLAALRSWSGWVFECDLRQGLARRAGESTTPRLAIGVSRSPWRWIEGRAGVALGGRDGPLLAAGAGFAVWKLRLDFAAATARGIDFTDPRGLAAGVSLGLRWDGGEPVGR